MATNDFPSKYNKHVDEITYEKINTARRQNSVVTTDVSRQRYSQPKSGNGAKTGAAIGFNVGFFVCVGFCATNLSSGFDDASATGVIAYVVFFVVALIFGFIADAAASEGYKANESRINERIASENRSLEEQIAAFEEESRVEKAKYLSWFENTSQNMSVRFAESVLAKEVIEWMTDGFFRTIDAADRRPHIQTIDVPFIFKIYRDKIACNLGTYDFELKRCAFLKSPLEQTALSRAIATQMQLNTVVRYPEDSSGTAISIRITYKYEDDYICTTISYIAPNGYFKNVTEW